MPGNSCVDKNPMDDGGDDGDDGGEMAPFVFFSLFFKGSFTSRKYLLNYKFLCNIK